MDQNQEQVILQAIAVSSSSSFGIVSSQDRKTAFSILEDFKGYEGRLPVCIAWLQQERLVVLNQQRSGQDVLEITVPTKLFALEILNGVMGKSYGKLRDNERLALRQAVIQAARQLAPSPVTEEARILGKKLAVLLAGLAVRDFPQRWTNFMQDMFSPGPQGGLWTSDNSTLHQQMGVKISLECLKLITEDCTDSDFNSKISTSRRNDVLIGLNEVSSQFLPLLFQVLEQYSLLSQTKATLHNMRSYLASNQRTLAQMSPDEAVLYQSEMQQLQHVGRLISDCLVTLERFCQSMPLDWMWSYEFIPAFLHLLREPTCQVQVYAVACLEAISLRGKLEMKQWLQLIAQLPPAVTQANQQLQVEQEHQKLEDWVNSRTGLSNNSSSTVPLSMQLDFHRSLSRMLSHMVSSHLAHISTDRELLEGRGSAFECLSTFLRLLVDMLHHPSGIMASEQINTWIALMRDPHIAKSRLLQPLCEEILSRYMDHTVRLRWEDVENQVHPFSSVLEASWDDEDEYDAWFADLRSKASQLFKLIGNTEPQIASRVLNSRVQLLLSAHGNGEPHDHLEPTNNQLTQKSEAVLCFEGLCQPLEYVTAGLPSWSLVADTVQKDDKHAQSRLEIRTSTSTAMSQLSNAIVSWNPNYVWLKFRRAQLLESMKHFWRHDPATLLQGVDSLLTYLSAPDDWGAGSTTDNGEVSGEVISLRKKSAVALISVSKHVPQHLVPWLPQLSEATRNLLSSTSLLPATRMHLYEFLSCVATAVEDPVARSNFIADVLSDAISTIESVEIRENISSVEKFLSALGITDASSFPASVTDPTNVKQISTNFSRMYSAFNQLVSVGKRCHEAARKRPNGGIPFLEGSQNTDSGSGELSQFPDEGPVSIGDLNYNDPFVPLWPRILPSLLQVLDVTLRIWRPECQAILLKDRLQRFALAISDDDAYLTKKTDAKSGGVFGEGGTAGSIVSGTDRRDANLVPRWSGWFNELRNTCFQLLGLLAGERALYAPELSNLFPRVVDVVGNDDNLRSMEHRHLTQYLKQFIEILMLSCPSTMYATHMEPLLRPVLEHLVYRLDRTWRPILCPGPPETASEVGKALTSAACDAAAFVAARGGEEWFAVYYARSGLFVGDLDNVTAEAAVEKYRVEVTRTVSDVLQSVLALKGDWALVLANIAKEEQAMRNNDASKLLSAPKTRLTDGGPVNADGTPRVPNQVAIDARKVLRISALCHFLLLESEAIAGNLTLLTIQCLEYPDAYTCRRFTRICHRILETVAWTPQYTDLLGNRMFLTAIKNVVTEPKWMVGIEWDMINLVRDIYCRLWLGQMLQPGGQGPGLQQPSVPGRNNLQYEQAKTVDRPLQGGGILAVPSSIPREILARLPGVGLAGVEKLDDDMRKKRSAKDQKDFFRDLLRIVADNLQEAEDGQSRGGGAAAGLFERAVHEESLLHTARRPSSIPDIPERLITQSMVAKQASKDKNNKAADSVEGLAAFKF